MNDSRTLLDETNERVRRTELIISYTLRIGVMVSLLLIVSGMGISFIRHPEYLTSHTALTHLTTPGSAFPHSLGELAAGLKSGRGQSVVLLGLLLLIATPVVRVGISVLVFVQRQDPVFVAITSTVLLLLLVSFFLGHVTQ